MKTRLFNLFLIILATVASMTSCRELAQNGDLSGQWQILSIDHTDGTATDPEGKAYYCFYRNVAQLTNTNTTRVTANMVYDEKARTITLQFPYNSPAQLNQWGITQAGSALDPDAEPTDPTAVTILINHLSASRLVMTLPGGNTVTCRKY